jgi:hypothetical protein
MALVVKSTGNTIAATDVNQYHDLFTGVMTDQPIGLTYLPGTSTSTPVLLVKGNTNGPLLQAYNGATQEFSVDQSGVVYGKGMQLGDKLFGSGANDQGFISGTTQAVIGGTHVWLKENNYNNGTNDIFTANGSAYQFNVTAGSGNVPAWRYALSGTAGATITWASWLTLALMRSAGGGNAGSGVWVGTSDPAGSANEGDIWVVG